MKARRFINALDERRVVEAVRSAESGTSGEIRVFVTRRKLRGGNACARGHAEFRRLRMDHTALRNGILFYVVPEDRIFSVIGDVAVHQECGQPFWDEIAAVMEEYFREEKFTEGLLSGIERAGKIMARHFPRQANDRNELPDSVVRD